MAEGNEGLAINLLAYSGPSTRQSKALDVPVLAG
jgi:hypothetical protein